MTGRLGYAAGPALFYAKGGWGYLDTNRRGSLRCLAAVYTALVITTTRYGWTVGGGIEYMWSPTWSVKAEYLYFDFGKKLRYNYADGSDLPG